MENKPVPTELLDLYANMGFATKDLEEWEGHTRTIRSVQVAVEYAIKQLDEVRKQLEENGKLAAATVIITKMNKLKQLLAS